MKATPMPAGLEQLTLDLVGLVRQYERNCRCPRCHQQALQCTECEFCQANLQKLFLRELTEKPPAMFSVCQSSADRPTILTMQKKSGKAAKLRTKPKGQSAAFAQREYDRRIHVTFPTAGDKKMVGKAAKSAKMGLGAYAAAAAVDWAQTGKVLEMKPQAVAGTGNKGKGQGAKLHIFGKFATPALKKLAKKAAASTGASLSSYTAAAAIERAMAGWTPKALEQAEAAKAS